jgi:hypothetical protein
MRKLAKLIARVILATIVIAGMIALIAVVHL